MRSACSTVFLVVCGLNAAGACLLSCGSSTSDAPGSAGSAGDAGNANGALGAGAHAGTAGNASSGTGGASTTGGSTPLGDAGDGAMGGDSAMAGGAGTAMSPQAVSDKYNFAPATRTVKPVAVFKTTGNIVNPKNVLSGQATAIVGKDSAIIVDFGKEVGGIITLTFAEASDAMQRVGLAFSETSTYAGPNSDLSNGSGTPDGAIFADVASTGASTYTVPQKYLRGGFRYLTVFLSSAGYVHLKDVSLAFSPDPERAVPNQYPNYFYSNDELLNRAWYAGAYTVQTNIVRNHEGRAWPPANGAWDNSLQVGESGNAVLTDAAKRDRTVWPGDMAISLPTAYASLFDTLSSKNSLQTLFNHQGADGGLPYAGPPMNFGGSDSYHLWSLLGAELYYLYSGDKPFLDGIWKKFQAGVTFSTAKLAASGLLNVTGTNDWARDNPGGENIQSNVILFGVLDRAGSLADAEGDATLAASYRSQAATLKARINAVLWDASRGAYKDNPTSTLYPQDGNALAVWFGAVDAASKAKSISYVLNENWNTIGSRGPEFTFGTGTPRISTFAGSMELMSHFQAGYDRRALDMIRQEWGFMLNRETGPQSTFWEGFESGGNLAYQGSFTSSAHGWGTGPTSALTFYVLGIQPETAAGAKYRVVPHPGDLTHVEGNLTLSAGQSVSVSYHAQSACRSFSMRVDSHAAVASIGTIGVPTFGAKHTISVDGAVAMPSSEDLDYSYFSGVTAGIHSFSWHDGNACAPAPEAWTFCADENGNCSFTGKKRVRFGKRGSYQYAIVDGGTACTSAPFGGVDPLPNVPKSCQTSDELYTACSKEGETCTVAGTKQVRFGANGQWRTRTITGGTPCDAATFGDPLAHVQKRCEWRDAP